MHRNILPCGIGCAGVWAGEMPASVQHKTQCMDVHWEYIASNDLYTAMADCDQVEAGYIVQVSIP
jgi:hypothetical protein